MKTQPSLSVDWAQLYGRLAEAVDYAGFDITPNSDATVLTLTPREPLPPSPASEKWHSPLAKVAAVYGFTGTWEQIADALIAARQPLGYVPDGVWEALQRIIENSALHGPASNEDAILVARYRRDLLAARQPVGQEAEAYLVMAVKDGVAWEHRWYVPRWGDADPTALHGTVYTIRGREHPELGIHHVKAFYAEPPVQAVDLEQLSALLGNARTYLTQGLNSQCMNLLGDALALINSGKAGAVVKRTRKVRALELLRTLENGPNIGTPTRFGVLKSEAEADAKLWLQTWVIPEVRALIPELKDKK